MGDIGDDYFAEERVSKLGTPLSYSPQLPSKPFGQQLYATGVLFVEGVSDMLNEARIKIKSLVGKLR